MSRPRRRRVGPPALAPAAAVILAVGLVACGDDGRPAAASPSGPVATDQILAAGTYDRHARVTGRVQVALTNRGSEPVEVVRFQVRHPMFATVPPEDRESVLRPGATVVRPLPFGEPRCEATSDRGAVVVLGVRRGAGSDGTVTEVTVPMAEGRPGLAAWHATACAVAGVGETARFRLGPESAVEQDGTRLRTTLRAERRGPGEVAVMDVGNSILFSIAPAAGQPAAGQPVLTLPDGRDAAATEVVLTVARCDVHALIESKTSFTFPLSVAVGDGDPVAVPVTADDPVRATMQAMLEDVCDIG